MKKDQAKYCRGCGQNANHKRQRKRYVHPDCRDRFIDKKKG